MPRCGHLHDGVDVACQEGVEPPTARLEGGCSIQLSYWQPEPVSLRHSRQRDSSKALLTTLTLLKAMAAPASIGLSPPKAASGMPMML